jgi:Permuted papain-like amidase enzyme, YaeF/YiiX, C92 family
MQFFLKFQIRWPTGCLIFLFVPLGAQLVSCKSKDTLQPLIVTKQDSVNLQKFITRAYKDIAVLKTKIQSGDLITRTGNDYTSQRLRSLNQRNQTYSHCGIASIENDSLFIYHAVGGEWNPDEKLRRDVFELFAEPYSNKGIGIFRFALPDTTKLHLMEIAKQQYSKGLKFDLDFDLQTDDRMYCAEFIYKSLLKASNHRMVFNRSKIGQFIFIGVDDIFLHPLCSMTQQIVYK